MKKAIKLIQNIIGLLLCAGIAVAAYILDSQDIMLGWKKVPSILLNPVGININK